MPDLKDLSPARHFADLPDPRMARTRKHKLLDILALTLCAVISGCDTFYEVEDFGREREDRFKGFLELPHGIPSHDTTNRVFAALHPKRFNECVGRWMEAVCEATGLRHIAADGKSAKSAMAGMFTGCLHPVGVWATENGVILGQEAVAEKSNEIAAIPELLRVLQLRGAVVTIDAAGCRKGIARQIRARGGHHLLAVKGNQPKSEEAIRAQFECACEAGTAHSHHASSERGHGRQEERDVTVIADPAGLPEGWADAAAVVLVGRERTAGGVTTATAHFDLTSLKATAEELGKPVRNHWSVETNCTGVWA